MEDHETDTEASDHILEVRQQLIVHDPINGSFTLPSIAWKIVDTPEFQRLRLIKQTGNTCYVYPGAEHSRFQHSLGVAHLSMEFGRAVKMKVPDMISHHEILLLCIAGLCHDLGHCAFSHLYDSRIIPMFNQASASASASASILKHEEASYRILQRIWNKCPEVNATLSKSDIQTIGKMILGSPDKVPESLRDEIVWTEYDRTHAFLFEVVSNERTGIDVDKFDYLKRDSHYIGIPCTFDPQRLMNFLSMERMDGKYVVNFLRKSDELVNSMWQARDDLHRRAYQHRVVKCVDLMTVEMIRRCADALVPNTDVRLKDAHRNLDSYLMITDISILSMAEQIPEAKEILDKIRGRDLWPTVAIVINSKPLDLSFTTADIRIAEASLHNEYIYYLYNANDAELDKEFYIELIDGAKGGDIRLRHRIPL